MAEEIKTNIRIDVDTSDALASLKTLQSQISTFNQSVIQSNAQAVATQKKITSDLVAQIGATRQFTTSITNIESSVSRLGKSIDKNKLSMGEYFRYGVASSKNFGRVFGKEHTQIMDLAADRVKRLQTQYIALGEAQNGMTRAMAVRPMNLFNADAAIAVQRQQLFNKLLHDGSTSIINFGKNTQWAGRQLMVGFTVPLTIFGGMAGQVFMDLERQIVNFRRVYGDATTPLEETNGMIEQIKELASEFTKYGIAVKDTVALASDAAAAGAQADDLLAQTAQATRLSTLGMIDQQQALTATIALQSAFRLSSDELAQSVDFLNAVENQTVVSLSDITEAIPTVAPVIQGLGGDVKDLAVFMAALREGGVNASEGANALKSGLASLINPTKAAREQLEKVGINIDAILKTNKGDIQATVRSFGEALMTLDKFERQQTLAKVFGKYQFARLGALFENITRDGSQAQRVVDLTGQSIEQLGELADKELSAIEESVGMKFTGAMERLKLAIAPIGEAFLKVATPIIDFATKILEKFDELSPGAKQFVTILTAGIGVVVPTVIMLIGLIGNFVGQAMKGFSVFNNFFNRLRGGGSDLEYLSEQQLDAMAASNSLEGQTSSLTSALNVQRDAVIKLSRSYRNYVNSATAAASGLPQGFRTPRKMATGGIVPGTGNGDTVPALLTPGESVITKEATKKFGPILSAMNSGKITGFAQGQIDIGGGKTIPLNLKVKTGEASIQTMFDKAEKIGKEIKDSFVNILRSVQETQEAALKTGSEIKTSAKDIKRMAIEQGLPAKIFPSGEGTYKASAAGIKTSVKADIASLPGITPQQAEQEYQRAKNAAQGAETAINKYYDQLLANVNLEDAEREKLQKSRDSMVKEALQVSRAHAVEVTSLQKTFAEAWSPELWLPQSQVENQLSNILSQSESARNIYERHLREIVSDTNQADEIMSKVNRNLALTDEELQIQGTILSRMLANSQELAQLPAGFAPYAAGTVGAAQARSASAASTYYGAGSAATRGAERAAALRTVEAAEQSWKDVWKISSPSEAGAEIGDNINEGVAQGLRRSVSKPVAAAAEVANEVKGQMAMEFEDDDALFSAQPYKGERRLTNAPVPKATGRNSLGLQVAPQEVQNKVRQQVVDNLIKETQRASLATVGLTNQTSLAARAMGSIKTGASKFGASLIKGSTKLTGAMFAIDGLVFAASMMDNSVGQFAQQIMPAVFAIQGVAMVLPMIKSMVPLLMTPVGAVAAALVALGAGIFLLKRGMDNVVNAGKKIAESMTLATNEIDSLASYFGNTTRNLKSGKQLGQIEGLTPEMLTAGREFVQSDFGKEFTESAKLSFEQNAAGFARNLANQLSMAVISGAMTPDQAKTVAVGIAEALGQEEITADIVGKINQILDPQGNDITNSPLQIIAQIKANIEADEEDLKRQAARAAALYGDSFSDNILNLGSLYSGEYDEVIRTAVAAYDSIIANSKSLFDTAQNEIAIQDEKIKKLDEQARKEDNLEKKRKIQDQARQERERRELLVAQQKSTADQRRADALQYLNSLEGAAREEAIKASRTTLQAAAPGLDMAGIAARMRNDLARKMAAQGTPMPVAEQETAVMKFEIDMLMGTIDPMAFKIVNDLIAQGGETGEAAKKTLSYIFDLQMSGQVEEANDVLTLYSTMTDKQRIEYDIIVNTPGKSPEEVIAYGNFLKQLPDEIPDSIRTEIITAANGMTVEQLNNYAAVLGGIGALPEVLKKFISVESLGFEGLKKLTGAYNTFQSKRNAKKQAEVAFGTTDPQQIAKNLDAMGMSLEDFAKKPSSFKMAIMAAANVQIAPPPGLPPYAVASWLEGERRRLMGLTAETLDVPTPKTTGGTTPPPKDEKGGGDKQLSWLEELQQEIAANFKLFIQNVGKNTTPLIQQLRNLNIPEKLIEAIGAGPEGLKKAKELLGLDAKERARLIKRYGQAIIAAPFLEKQQAEINKQKNTDDAKTKLQKMQRNGLNIEKDILEEILKDEEAINTVLYGTNEQIQKMVKNYGILRTSQEIIDAKVKEIKKDHEAIVKVIDGQIDAQEKVVKGIQDQIDALEQKNEEDQWTIRGKEREKELIDRQVESLERANEMDERRIESLQRQDELRNREADALSHELELMSKAEQKIRDAYEQRINALDQVAKINDYIINQQQNQLGLAQALTSGDIAAAAQARQQMQAADAQFAVTQMREGLQQGMENQVAGLTTQGGLTREQAEQKINDIKEQSYQTSLLIRDIEDTIYNRNQQMIPLKDQQYAIDLKIRDIQDQIYARDTQINDIKTKQLEPAQKILDSLNTQKSDMQAIVDESIRQIEAIAEQGLMAQETTKEVDKLARAWNEVRKQINDANTMAKNGLTGIGDRPTPQAGQTNAEFNKKLSEWETKRSEIESARRVAAETALATGKSAMNLYTGGQVKRYATGGISGDGGRDSVAAMLTPGEYVVRKSAVNKYGKTMFDKINMGAFEMPRYNTSTAGVGTVSAGNNKTNISTPVYNTYSVNVTVPDTNASPDVIANKVLMRIAETDRMNIRSIRGNR